MKHQDLNASVYEAEVDHRLEHVQRYLWDVRRGQDASVMVPLWNLRALQDESRQAGYKDISELCGWMERSIISLDMLGGRSPRNASARDNGQDKLLSEIARVGDYIRQRAHSLTAGAFLGETPVSGTKAMGTEPGPLQQNRGVPSGAAPRMEVRVS